MIIGQDNRAELVDELKAAEAALEAAAHAVGTAGRNAPARARHGANSKRSPARQGKKAIAFWVDPGASTQLRIAAASMDRSVQEIMSEALEDMKHRLPRLAAGGSNGAEPRSEA